MNMRDIKPCPFCGRTDKLTITGEEQYNYKLNVNGTASVVIRCQECCMDMVEHIMYHPYNTKYETLLASLMKRWNTRP